ncbi:TrmB family transcriptional regulator [Halalkalicoccus sp. NIPERK01]|uniref:TrmB family transcriptional regulator n=1 Tax=Halalkalicoccus sp. NIPERK01 TaxID=3053469 RepID=UPI00256F2BC2|nr:helix-turn-helix domain-containing protein [Halalkalicoccus sp. NIPERK01]MDL5361825.1 helix-turn-helix domain-containing protein [Halalkalicoccus sp. NIPERK01]
MTTDETAALDALERLGLSNYEAKVFIALQTLGTGTARDVYRVSEIPRSQVYGAAESLAERGLIEVQHSTPMQYRPVSLAEAEELLEERFERERTQAFDYLAEVRERHDPGPEEREDIWSVNGVDHVSDRIEHLIRTAEERVVFGAGAPRLARESLREALREAAERGVEVVIVSEDAEVRALFEDAPVAVHAPPEVLRNVRTARMLVVDDRAVLLSVRGDGEDQEAAFWSESSGFATVLVELLTGWLETAVVE